jgi:tRNA threonylcarbamoyladenosine biosynthesis protein TsaE
VIELPADIVTPTAAATIAWGRELAASLPDFAVLLLVGELGAGKTTLMKGLAAGWGVATEDEVASPTYTLVHEYRAGNRVLYHLDLYRLSTAAELATLGLEDIFAPPLAGEAKLVAVEWGERLAEPLRSPCLRIELAADGDARRIRAHWRR